MEENFISRMSSLHKYRVWTWRKSRREGGRYASLLCKLRWYGVGECHEEKEGGRVTRTKRIHLGDFYFFLRKIENYHGVEKSVKSRVALSKVA